MDFALENRVLVVVVVPLNLKGMKEAILLQTGYRSRQSKNCWLLWRSGGTAAGWRLTFATIRCWRGFHRDRGFFLWAWMRQWWWDGSGFRNGKFLSIFPSTSGRKMFWPDEFSRCKALRETPVTFEQFVAQSDYHLYDPRRGLSWIIDRADVRLINQTSNLHHLHQMLIASDLTDNRRLRPDWDQYFMKLAFLAAQRSNCMKRRVGCVLVREKRVISTGYNGTPRNLKNCNEGGCKSSSPYLRRLLRGSDWTRRAM